MSWLHPAPTRIFYDAPANPDAILRLNAELDKARGLLKTPLTVQQRQTLGVAMADAEKAIDVGAAYLVADATVVLSDMVATMTAPPTQEPTAPPPTRRAQTSVTFDCWGESEITFTASGNGVVEIVADNEYATGTGSATLTVRTSTSITATASADSDIELTGTATGSCT